MEQQPTPIEVKDLKYDAAGLIPAVIQDARSGEILMLAYMNCESLARTLETDQAWFWSRSRGRLWHKGEESGAVQQVQEVLVDCDMDTLVLRVDPRGPACHTGRRTCFFRRLQAEENDRLTLTDAQGTAADASARRLMHTISAVSRVIADRRRQMPEGSYTAYLFEQGLDKILKKIGEESAEVIIASKNEHRGQLVGELSDLIYHLLILAEERGIGAEELALELEGRKK